MTGRRAGITLVAALACLLVVVLSARFFAGVLGGTRAQAHPPCEELPGVAEVDAALRSAPDLTALIEQQGDDVRVQIGRPCGGDPVAVVEVSYKDAADLGKIEEVLTQADGFGVPVTVVQRE